jgi:hypothetical protein
MADEIRNGDSKVRVVRLLEHRDDAGAWEIRDFLKRNVVGMIPCTSNHASGAARLSWTV